MFKYLVSQCSRSRKKNRCHTSYYFQFISQCSPCPLDIHIQSHSIPHFASLMIVFVPSRRQCQLTAVGLLTFCAADGTTDHFLHAHASDIKNHLKHINDKTLVETLQHEVGFITKLRVSKINEFQKNYLKVGDSNCLSVT